MTETSAMLDAVTEASLDSALDAVGSALDAVAKKLPAAHGAARGSSEAKHIKDELVAIGQQIDLLLETVDKLKGMA